MLIEFRFCDRLYAESLFFYNLDQIVCVGACIGEAKKQARQLKNIYIPILN